MNVRSEVKRIVGQILKAQAESDHGRISRLVSGNYHILPAWVIERVFGSLSPKAMLAVVPYIPRRVYTKIPKSFAMYEALRPLVYMRPATQLWDLQRFLICDSSPWHTMFATWYAVNRDFACTLYELRDCGIVRLRRVLENTSLSRIHKILPAAAQYPDNQDALVWYMASYEMRAIRPSHAIATLKTCEDCVGWSILHRYMEKPAAHYKIIAHVARVCIDSGEDAPSWFCRSAASYLRAGKLFLRLPPSIKAWFFARASLLDDFDKSWRLLRRWLTPRERRLINRERLCHRLLTNI